jgi:hypothetical protein
MSGINPSLARPFSRHATSQGQGPIDAGRKQAKQHGRLEPACQTRLESKNEEEKVSYETSKALKRMRRKASFFYSTGM